MTVEALFDWRWRCSSSRGGYGYGRQRQVGLDMGRRLWRAARLLFLVLERALALKVARQLCLLVLQLCSEAFVAGGSRCGVERNVVRKGAIG